MNTVHRSDDSMPINPASIEPQKEVGGLSLQPTKEHLEISVEGTQSFTPPPKDLPLHLSNDAHLDDHFPPSLQELVDRQVEKDRQSLHENETNVLSPKTEEVKDTLEVLSKQVKEARSAFAKSIGGRVASKVVFGIKKGNTWIKRSGKVFRRVMPMLTLTIPTLIKIKKIAIVVKLSGVVLGLGTGVITIITAPIALAKTLSARKSVNAHTEQMKALSPSEVDAEKVTALLANRQTAFESNVVRYEEIFEKKILKEIETVLNTGVDDNFVNNVSEGLKKLSNNYGIHLENLEVRGAENLKNFNKAPPPTSKEVIPSLVAIQKKLEAADTRPKLEYELRNQYIAFEETIQPLARNAMLSMGLAKQKIEKDYFKLTFAKVMVMAPLGITVSAMGLGAFACAVVGVAFPPLLLIAAGLGVTALGAGFGAAGFAYGLYHKPNTMKETYLKFNEFRESSRELPVLWSEFQVSRLKERQMKLMNKAVSEGLSNEKKAVAKAEAEKIGEHLAKARATLEKRQTKLNKVVNAMSQAGIKDTAKKLPEVNLIFEKSEKMTLLHVMTHLHEEQTTDESTLRFLKTIHGMNPSDFNSANIENEFTKFYGGNFKTMAQTAANAKAKEDNS